MKPHNMLHDPPTDGLFPWPREHFFRRQTFPIQDPSNTYFASQLSMMIGTNQKYIPGPDPQDALHGAPYAPGYIHFKDIVLYRIIDGAMKSQSLKINLITNPALFNYQCMKTAVAERHLGNDLSYCANMACMALAGTHSKCQGCHVR